MLDVAQNTARLNSLIGRYYTAEFQLEEKTESKLQLGQQGSQNTIDKNKNALSIMDKYDQLEADLASNNSAVVIDGATPANCHKDNGVVKSKDQFLKENWEANHPKPSDQDPEYAKVTAGTDGFTEADLIDDAPVTNYAQTMMDKDRPADPGTDPGDPGSEPTEAQYTTGTGSSATVDTTAYNNAKAEWNKKVEAKKEYDEKKKAMDEYNNNFKTNFENYCKEFIANGYQQQVIDAENKERAEKLKEAQDNWATSRSIAGDMYQACVDACAGKEDAFTKAKAREQERADLEFNIGQKELSMKESLLDQEIQALQAEVTAIKTEIDSLKQERNSNVQSDFKLFG